MTANRKPIICMASSLLVVLLLAGLVMNVQYKLDKMTDRELAEKEVFYVPSGSYLKPLVLGYDMAVADIYWLKTVQYIGEKTAAPRTYKWLYPLVDLVTTLDPRFSLAYDSAGVVLAVYAKPQRLDESNAILKKGMEQDQDSWSHPFFLSFNHFQYMNDYLTAAKYMTVAAAKPKHPHYTEKLAAKLYAQARDPESGILFLSSVIESTKDENVKKELEERLVQLVTERDLNMLDAAVKWHQQNTGRKPVLLQELIASGALTHLPQEPGGGYYYIDSDGSVKSITMVKRLRIFGKENK